MICSLCLVLKRVIRQQPVARSPEYRHHEGYAGRLSLRGCNCRWPEWDGSFLLASDIGWWGPLWRFHRAHLCWSDCVLRQMAGKWPGWRIIWRSRPFMSSGLNICMVDSLMSGGRNFNTQKEVIFICGPSVEILWFGPSDCLLRNRAFLVALQVAHYATGPGTLEGGVSKIPNMPRRLFCFRGRITLVLQYKF